jgi:bacteriorhodopsin
MKPKGKFILMKQLKISDAKNSKNRQRRAFIAYFLLVVASLVILFAGYQVIYLFGFELNTKIREVDSTKAALIFITMLPLVSLILYLTLNLISKLYKIFNI